MTDNERLYDAGLLEDFDAAAKRGDVETMTRLLISVELTPDDATRSAALILANPRRYGL
jgi:hypothetical protein